MNRHMIVFYLLFGQGRGGRAGFTVWRYSRPFVVTENTGQHQCKSKADENGDQVFGRQTQRIHTADSRHRDNGPGDNGSASCKDGSDLA